MVYEVSFFNSLSNNTASKPVSWDADLEALIAQLEAENPITVLSISKDGVVVVNSGITAADLMSVDGLYC